MTIPTLRRPFSAWSFLVDVVRAMTAPRMTVEWCDERVEAIVAESRIAETLSSAARLWNRAFSDSVIVAAGRRRMAPHVPGRPANRVRAVGYVTAAAAATTLALSALGTEREPAAWMLPAGVFLLAILLIIGSERITRAMSHDRS